MSNPDDPQNEGGQRYKRVDLQRKVSLKFKEFQGFITEYSENISAGGMFIRTKEPQQPGSIFDFEFTLGEDFTLIHGLGEVVWVRDEDEGFDRPAGMGVRFLSLDEKSRQLIDRMVAERLVAQQARAAEPVAPDTHWGMAGAPASAPSPGAPPADAQEDETVAEGIPAWLPPQPASGEPAGEPAPASGDRPSLFDMLPDPKGEKPAPVVEPDEPAGGGGESESRKRPIGPSPYARSYPVSSAQVAVGGDARSRRPWLVVALVVVALAVAGGAVLYFFPGMVGGWVPWGGEGDEAEVADSGEGLSTDGDGPGTVTDTPSGASTGQDPPAGSETAVEEPGTSDEGGAEGGQSEAGVMGMVGEPAVEEDGPAPGGGRSEREGPPAIPASSEIRGEPAAEAPSRPATGGSVPVPPAPEEEPFTRVLNITWEQLDGELLITVHLDGAVREWDYSHVRVGSPPPRELVIIRGVREPFGRKTIPVAASMVDQVRVGFHPKQGGNELHVVLDVARPTVYLERMEASGREIRLYVTVRER